MGAASSGWRNPAYVETMTPGRPGRVYRSSVEPRNAERTRSRSRLLPPDSCRAAAVAAVVVAAVLLITPHAADSQDQARAVDSLGWLLAVVATACLAWSARWPLAVLACSSAALAA